LGQKHSDRFQQVAGLAGQPTPVRRLGAAFISAALVLAMSALVFVSGPDVGFGVFISVAGVLAIVAAAAAALSKLGMVISYGTLAVVWLFLEGLVAAIAVAISCIG